MRKLECDNKCDLSKPSLVKRMFAPVDVASLVFFRIAFGAIMLWECWRYYDAGRIERYYMDPQFFFTFEGFDWVQPWPGNGMYIHWIALAVLSVMIMLGAFYRLCATLFFLGFAYIFLLDKANYLNHFYLITLISFVMIFLPTHRAFSVDALLWCKRRSQVVPAWTLWLLRFQIAVPYVFGGLAKWNDDWLLGEPMRMWLADRTDFPVIGRYFTQEWMVFGMSYSGLLLDLFIVPLLLWRKTRWLAIGVAVAFHMMNAQLFSIGIFPWFMIAATLIFLDPSWPRKLAFWKWKRKVATPASATTNSRSAERFTFTRGQRWTVAALAIYMFFQIAIPFRHHLYPGNVNWTEEGHRFSWHMKLRSKRGSLNFYARNEANQRLWWIDHGQYLTDRQRRKVEGRPDMILQLSHFLAEQIREEQGVNVQVFARSTISLNGREPQLLIDPNVDLSQEKFSFKAKPWILPLEKPLLSAVTD